MKEIRYGSSQFYTADVIGDALLRCSEALSLAGQVAFLEIPIVVDRGAEVVQMMVGSGIHIRAADSPGWSADGGSDVEIRDEFGSPATDGCPMIALVGRAAVHRFVAGLDEKVRWAQSTQSRAVTDF